MLVCFIYYRSYIISFLIQFSSNLGHLLPVGFGIEGGFCQQSGVLLWSHTELIVERVMPYLVNINNRH